MSPFFHSGAEKATSMCDTGPSSPELDDFDEAPGQRVVLVVEGLHHHHAGVGAGCLGHRASLVGIRREGFLAQHVLARLERGDGPVAVQAVGQWVVDGVDLGVVDQLLVAVMDPVHVMLGGERNGAVAVAGGHGDHRRLLGAPGRLDQRGGGDLGRPEDADPQHETVTRTWCPATGDGRRGRPRPQPGVSRRRRVRAVSCGGA